MEQLCQYQTVISNIAIDSSGPSMTTSIQSVLSKTKHKLKHLSKMLYPNLMQDALFEPNSVRSRARRSIINASTRKRIKLQFYLRNANKTTDAVLQSNFSNASYLQFNTTHKTTTRNKVSAFNDNFTCSLNITQPIQSTFDKSTTTQRRQKMPKLCLLLPNSVKRQKEHSPEGIECAYSTPSPFTLNDPHTSTQQKKSITHSSKLIKKKCAVIETTCHSVDRAVKRRPIKMILDKQKLEELLNESNDTINDLTDSKNVKVENDHVMKLSVKTKQILRETEWIHKMNPGLAFEANKRIKTMFSIKPTDKSEEEFNGCKLKEKFNRNRLQMSDLLKKNLNANKKCSEYFARIQLRTKKAS